MATVACAGRAPIRQKAHEETLVRIAKAGDFKNIQRWNFLTPTQLSLMQQANLLLRVILVGGNGTGKTFILDEFAIKTAKDQPDEVIFAIHLYYSSARPLLQLELENKYEMLKLNNIKVMTFTKFDEIKDVCGINTTICIDEVRMKYVKPEDLLNIETKALWIVIRDTRTENPEEYLRTHFPDWDIAKLNYPLRTSKNISEKVKRGYVASGIHNNRFNASLQVAPNMPFGPNTLFLPI